MAITGLTVEESQLSGAGASQWERLFADRKGGVKVSEVPAWKLQVMKDAEKAGIIMPNVHKPEEILDKAFVLEAILNAQKGGK